MTFVKELEKVLKPQNIIILVGIIVVGMALCHYTDQKNSTVSGFLSESSTPPISEIHRLIKVSLNPLLRYNRIRV